MQQQPALQIVSHRGARALWPENSMTGFRNTLALGVDAVEFDVHPTRDGKLAVIHDATLDRTTDATGAVAARSLAELRAVRLTGTEESVPSLSEVVALLAPSGLDLHVELKSDAEGVPYDGLPERVLAELDRHRLAGRLVLTSFDPAVLQRLRSLRPDVVLLASMNAVSAERLGGVQAALDLFEGLGVAHVAVEQSLLGDQLELFTARLPPAALGVWTVNETAAIARWIAEPVGLITTDRPDLVRLALRRDPAAGGGMGGRRPPNSICRQTD